MILVDLTEMEVEQYRKRLSWFTLVENRKIKIKGAVSTVHGYSEGKAKKIDRLMNSGRH